MIRQLYTLPWICTNTFTRLVTGCTLDWCLAINRAKVIKNLSCFRTGNRRIRRTGIRSSSSRRRRRWWRRRRSLFSSNNWTRGSCYWASYWTNDGTGYSCSVRTTHSSALKKDSNKSSTHVYKSNTPSQQNIQSFLSIIALWYCK